MESQNITTNIEVMASGFGNKTTHNRNAIVIYVPPVKKELFFSISCPLSMGFMNLKYKSPTASCLALKISSRIKITQAADNT